MTAMIAQAFESKVFQPEKHAQFAQNIEHWAYKAGIPVHTLCETATKYLSDKDLEVAIRYKYWIRKGYAGSVMSDENGSGKGKSIELRMQAMTALFVRNFINARMAVVSQVLSDRTIWDEDTSPTVLIIPNFLISNRKSKGIAAWDVGKLHELLVSRLTAGKFTILYSRNVAIIESEYGAEMAKHVRDHYLNAK